MTRHGALDRAEQQRDRQQGKAGPGLPGPWGLAFLAPHGAGAPGRHTWVLSQLPDYLPIHALAKVPGFSSSLAQAQTNLGTPIWEQGCACPHC